MTRLTRRCIQLCALLAATVALGQERIPSTADACATCITKDKCQDTTGGTQGCVIEGETPCQQLGAACMAD